MANDVNYSINFYEDIVNPKSPNYNSAIRPQYVYAYYFPQDKELAILKGKNVWPIKIGKTIQNPITRIQSQSQTGNHNKPIICFIGCVSNCTFYEAELHKKFQSYNAKSLGHNGGNEWFYINTEEIEKAIATIKTPSLYLNSNSNSNSNLNKFITNSNNDLTKNNTQFKMTSTLANNLTNNLTLFNTNDLTSFCLTCNLTYNLTYIDSIVLTILYNLQESKEGNYIVPYSYNYIADILQVSEKTIRRALNDLEKLYLIITQPKYIQLIKPFNFPADRMTIHYSTLKYLKQHSAQLSFTDIFIYNIIYNNIKEGDSNIAINDIRKWLNISQDTIIRSLKNLNESNLISIFHNIGKQNCYKIQTDIVHYY